MQILTILILPFILKSLLGIDQKKKRWKVITQVYQRRETHSFMAQIKHFRPVVKAHSLSVTQEGSAITDCTFLANTLKTLFQQGLVEAQPSTFIECCQWKLLLQLGTRLDKQLLRTLHIFYLLFILKLSADPHSYESSLYYFALIS